jgi:hypothetical protein
VTINKIVKAYIPILVGGMLVVHWWRSSLDPFIESSIPEFFISHLLLVLGIWFRVPRTQHGHGVAICLGALFVVYGFFMAALLIPGGFDEVGIFAIVIPVYLAALGVTLGTGSFFSRKIKEVI